MTALTRLEELRRRVRRRAPGPEHLDGTTFIIIYAGLLLLIPAALVFKPVGAAGTPAALWGIFGLFWWICARLGRLGPPAVASPVKWALGVFVLCVLGSYAWGMTTGWHAPADIHQATDDVYDLIPTTAQELRAKMIKGADRGLLALMAWAGVVLMCLEGLRRWRDVERLITWLVWFAAAVASIGLVQFFTGFEIAGLIKIPGLSANSDFGAILERSVLRRVYATATHPIEFGVLLAGLFPLALHRAVFSRSRVSGWLPPVLIGAAAMMSVSRSAVLVMGVSLVVLFLGWPPAWRIRAMVWFPIAAVVLRVLVPGLLGTIVSMWRNLFADPSTTGRTGDYAILFDVFGDNPVLGRGQFTFIPQYYRIMDNQFLVTLVELGLVGFTALLGLFLTSYLCARGARKRAGALSHQHLGLALSASIAGVFVAYATFDALGFAMVAGLTFLLFGLAGATWQLARDDQVSAVERTAAGPANAPAPRSTEKAVAG